jgi:DNA polymerase-3 subunit epsilon
MNDSLEGISLDLERPLVIFDLEATSTDLTLARIFQFAGAKFLPGGGVERMSETYDPLRPIPEEVEDLTGISDEDVQGLPTFNDCIGEVASFLKGADFCGHNIEEYDLPLIKSAFERSDQDFPPPEDRITIDTLQVEKTLSSLSLSHLFRRYEGEDFEGHQADSDVEATASVLSGQIDLFELSGLSASGIETEMFGEHIDPRQKFKKETDGSIVFEFGKHAGKTLEDVRFQNPGYIDWMIEEAYEDLGQYIEPHVEADG